MSAVGMRNWRNRTPHRGRGRGAGQWRPEQLGLRALYDYRASSASGMVDQSGNGRPDATVGAGSNSPLWLPYTLPSVYLPAGNTVTAPDTGNVFDITDDIDLRADVTLREAQASTSLLLSRGASSYILAVLTTGAIRFTIPTVYDATSTVFLTGLYGSRVQIRATRTRSSGDVSFCYRTDGDVAAHTGWTLVNTVTGLSTAAMAANSNAGQIGSTTFNGSVHRAMFISGVAGTTVADFNASACTQTGCTDTLANVWTVNRATSGRKTVVQSPAANSAHGVWLFGTDDYMTIPQAAIPPMSTVDSAAFVAVCRVFGFPINGTLLETRDGSFYQGISVYQPSAGNWQAYQGVAGGTTYAPFTPSTKSVVATQVVGRSATGLSISVNAGIAQTRDISAAGDLSALVDGKIGNNPSGAAPNDMEFEALLTADRVLTAAEIAQVVAFYGGGL